MKQEQAGRVMTESQGYHSLTPCIFQQTMHMKISSLLHHAYTQQADKAGGLELGLTFSHPTFPTKAVFPREVFGSLNP